MKVKDLRDMVRDRGLKGWSAMRKNELISFLVSESFIKPISDRDTEVVGIASRRTVKELRDIAKTHDVKIPSGSTKREIVYLLNQNYGERVQAYYSRRNNTNPEEEMERWEEEIREELSRRRPSDTPEPSLLGSALGGDVQRWQIDGSEYLDINVFLDDVGTEVKKLVDGFDYRRKVYLSLSCVLAKISPRTGLEETDVFVSRTRVYIISDTLGDTYDEMANVLKENVSKFQKNGSGWRLKRIIGLDISVSKFTPLAGLGYSALPPFVSKKKTVINIKNERCERDDENCDCQKCSESKMCFKWAATRALNVTKKKSERVTKELREQSKKYDWTGVSFPTKMSDVSVWENRNNVRVHVFGYDEYEKGIYTIRIGELTNPSETICLYLHDDDHFCVVRDLSRLISSQINKRDHGKDICLRCLCFFDRGDGSDKISPLERHKEYCDNVDFCRPLYPKPGSVVRFKNYERTKNLAFAVYADFECFVQPLDTVDKDLSSSFTTRYQSHVPSGFCYVIKCSDENACPTKRVSRTVRNENEDVGKLFVESLSEDVKRIYEFLSSVTRTMTKEDEERHESSEKCYACEGVFGEIREYKEGRPLFIKKRASYCYATGKYEEAVCDKCERRMCEQKFVPVYFHNLEGYDSHLFVKSLGLSEGDIKCIPKTDEKYISFSKNVVVSAYVNDKGEEKPIFMEMRFLDSLKFLGKSLDSMVKTLEENQFETLTQQMMSVSHLKLLKRKGVFPYEFMTDISKLETTYLPPKEMFCSRLTDSNVSDEDYEHAKTVWREFGCQTMRDYHDLYMETDVLLLADVMTRFRKTCKKTYGLDTCHYYTSPGLAWDVMLKYTKVEIDLVSDPDMYMMIEKGIVGGISTITKRYAVANNKYVENYDESKDSVFIPYLDANNLYGWAMDKPLPHKNFRWMSEEELKDWDSRPCILEVDLEYPEELHDYHNEYPLAPERLNVNNVDKLIPNLYDKTKYVVHHESLKLYLGLGLRLTKIHKGIAFSEEAFMRPYIKLNTDMRTRATTDFEKDFYKLMNNSVFGKTMENVRNRVNVKLVTNEKSFAKLVKKPNFQSAKIFGENLVAVHMKKTVVKLEKPTQLGMTILSTSKILMYEFHYDYVKPKWGENAKLLFTDTDSLCYEIRTKDFYENIEKDVDAWFDTSNYEKNHPLFSTRNKKRLGYVKDECGGNQILRFYGLRSKLYSYEVDKLRNGSGKWEKNVQKKRCKGIRDYVIKKHITIDDYDECLFSGNPKFRTMNVIRSRGHDVGSEKVNKRALSSDDDKRFVLEDKINTLAFGHYSLR